MIWLKNMRVLVAFAILVAVMSLIACGGGSEIEMMDSEGAASLFSSMFN